jgi:hydrogenase nickel incorporation protein HypB
MVDVRIKIEKKVLSENDRLAGQIRDRFTHNRIVSLNMVSSPGSGKTSLLERTFALLGESLRVAVIAGDVQTENDATRLAKAGGKLVKPLITGGACHLDACMIARALEDLNLGSIDLLFIENVGNLVCPSSYDLGEDMKVVLISTTEGDDKPLKYPAMFRHSSAMVINKTDLLGLSDFDVERVEANARRINGNLRIFKLSCRNGEGLELWRDWLLDLVTRKKRS